MFKKGHFDSCTLLGKKGMCYSLNPDSELEFMKLRGRRARVGLQERNSIQCG